MTMESVAEEILRQILVRLPTRAVAVGRCVCRQWRAILTDRSFLDHHAHAAHVVSGAGAEALLVSETKEPGMGFATAVFNASTGNKIPMCVLGGLDAGYSPSNACSGFLCRAAVDVSSNPVFVFNPITGDKLCVEPPPVSPNNWHMYAMGYSSSTRQYKLFGFSFSGYHDAVERASYMYVLTLGAATGGNWRLHQGLLRCQGMRSPLVIIDGRLYLVAKARKSDKKPDRLLLVEVASETHRMCRLPPFDATGDAVVDVLELHGRPCVAVQELGLPRRRLRFWVVSRLAPHGYYKWDQGWELRYSFDMGAGGAVVDSHAAEIRSGHPRPRHHPRAAWIEDDDAELRYMYSGHVYHYNITEGRQRRNCSSPTNNKDFAWDHRRRLSPMNARSWNVVGGYRPNLLSPHDLAAAPKQEEERSEHRLLRDFRSHKSPNKRRRSSSPPPVNDDNQQDAKFQYLRSLVGKRLRRALGK